MANTYIPNMLEEPLFIINKAQEITWCIICEALLYQKSTYYSNSYFHPSSTNLLFVYHAIKLHVINHYKV